MRSGTLRVGLVLLCAIFMCAGLIRADAPQSSPPTAEVRRILAGGFMQIGVAPTVYVFGPDGINLLVAGRGTVQMWAAPFAEPSWEFFVENHVLGAAFAPDGKHFLLLLQKLDAKQSCEMRSYASVDGRMLHATDLPVSLEPQGAIAATADPVEGLYLVRGKGIFRCSLVDESTAAEVLEKIDDLVKKLGDESYEVRQKAAKDLKKMGRVALPALKAAVMSEDDEVSTAALEIVLPLEKAASGKFFHSEGAEDIIRSDGGELLFAKFPSRIMFWEKAKNERGARGLAGVIEPILAYALSSDGTHLAVANGKNDISIYVPKINEDGSFHLPRIGTKVIRTDGYLEFSHDAKRIYTYDRFAQTICVWSVPDFRPLGEMKISGRLDIKARHVSPRGDYFVMNDHGLKIYKLADFELTLAFARAPRQYRPGVAAISADGRRVANVLADRKTLVVRDVATGADVFKLQCPVLVASVAMSRNGGRVAVSGVDEDDAKSYRVVEVASVRTVAEGAGEVLSVSADGAMLIVDAGNAKYRVVSVDGGKTIRGIEAGDRCPIFGADGRVVSLVRGEGSAGECLLRVCEATNGQKIAEYKIPMAEKLYAFDGKIAIIGVKRGVVVWDVAARKEIAALRGYDGEIVSAALVDGSKRVVTANANGSVWVSGDASD